MLIAKTAIYYYERQESYGFLLSVTLICIYTSFSQSTMAVKVLKTSCNTNRQFVCQGE